MVGLRQYHGSMIRLRQRDGLVVRCCGRNGIVESGGRGLGDTIDDRFRLGLVDIVCDIDPMRFGYRCRCHNCGVFKHGASGGAGRIIDNGLVGR